MEFLKAQLARIQEQIGALSASQKMLTMCLVAIMAMTIVWWTYWAAEPDMEPVLNQSLSQDDISTIVANLDGKGIAHKVVGDKVLVPADQKLEVLAELGYSQVLPRNFTTGFDDIIKNINWLDSPEKSDRMYLEAKQRTLAMVIDQFPGVSNAVVVIDPTNERRFDDTSVQPSAMVEITTTRSDRTSGKTLAASAASVVSGAEAGLTRSRINIVVDGVPCHVPDASDDDMGTDDTMVDALRQNEDFYSTKIRDNLGDVNGLMVAVTVKLNTSYTETHSHKVDPKGVVSIPIKSEETSDETTSGGAGGAEEAGAVANVGVAIPGGAGSGGNSSTSSDSKSEFQADNSHEDTFTKQSPGEPTVVAASVRVPRSYFVAGFKNKNDGKDPDDAALTGYEAQEIADIRQSVKACTNLTSDDAVVVAEYDDAPPPVMASVSTGGSPMSMMLGGHVKEIGVGALALVSMFMVSTMVKKTAPAPAVVGGGGGVLVDDELEARKLNSGEGVAGEVGEGGAALDGVELDEESVKAQQMIEQVQELVKANPDGAAGLVKRWMNQR
jgi:flagellar biosynthesis/type III secretory pathway M-ring protein FliF/YscJ